MQIQPIVGLEGLWTIEIPERAAGGIAVIANGQIHGGDNEFYFTGTYTSSNDEVEADVSMHRFRGNSPAFMGPPNGGRFVVIGRVDAARTVIEIWHPYGGPLMVVMKQRFAFGRVG